MGASDVEGGEQVEGGCFRVFLFFSFFFKLKYKLIYNVLLVSGVQHSDSIFL